MPDADIPSEARALIELIAEAICNELGKVTDADSGHRQAERVDPMNRAFRVAARAIVLDALGPDISLVLIAQTLCQAIVRRLTSEGWDEDQVRFLLEQGPDGPDGWLAILPLRSQPQIERDEQDPA